MGTYVCTLYILVLVRWYGCMSPVRLFVNMYSVHMLFDFRFAFYVCSCCCCCCCWWYMNINAVYLCRPLSEPPAPPLRICVCVSVLLLYVHECVSLLLCVLVCLLLVVIVALAVALLAWTFCFGSALSRLLINAVRRVFSLYLYVHKQIYKSARHAPPHRPTTTSHAPCPDIRSLDGRCKYVQNILLHMPLLPIGWTFEGSHINIVHPWPQPKIWANHIQYVSAKCARPFVHSFMYIHVCVLVNVPI